MAMPTLTLLHAPSTYDFREMTILRGPTSDLIPSSSIFEMYPIGFTSIANHLEKHGETVRIVNLAVRMMQDAHFDVEDFIQRLAEPLIFGLDLHWLPHAHGSLEIAKIVRQHHPHTPILLGGFSATYFHQEIMQAYPQVDFILRGDMTEEALWQLVQRVRAGGDYAQVPNLTWRDERGVIRTNPLTHSPATLDDINYDFRRLMVSSIRDRDLLSYMPFQGWLNYPIMPATSCHGCVMNCVGCGGSSYAFQRLHGRDRPAFRSAEKLAEDIFHTASVSNAPIFVIGDLRQAGEGYMERFFSAIKGLRTPIIIELFTPATKEYMRKVADSMCNFAVEFSIESHDPAVRHAYGKPYSNEQIESTISHILDSGARRLDLFFMTGLPKQSYDSVLGSADYADSLLKRFDGDGRLRPFIGPMAPFVDPGSRAFEEPDKHGYHIFFRSFEEHRQALLEPSWQFTLNYETRWMNRHDIVHSTYDACIRFAELKGRYNLIPMKDANEVIATLEEGKALATEIERYHQGGETHKIMALRPRIETVNSNQGVGEDKELRLSSRQVAFKWSRLVWLVLKSWADSLLRSTLKTRATNRDA